MSINLPDSLLAEFVKLIESELGLFYPKERHTELTKQLMHALHFASESEFATYISQMLHNSAFRMKHEDALAEALTIGETYYFRLGCGFEALESTLLPKLIQEKRGKDQTIRIWSASCCRGDEPYSIAILIDELLPLRNDWNIQILGTDINKFFLKRAQSGLVGDWSFRNMSEQRLQKYFKHENERQYRLSPKICSMVNFAYLNLSEDSYPSLENGTNGLDIILCNNTLFYFSNSLIQKIINKFTNCLRNNGHLIVSTVEASLLSSSKLNRTKFTNIFIKGDKEKEVIKIPEKRPLPFIRKVKSTPISAPKAAIAPLYLAGEYEQCISFLNDAILDSESAAILIRSYANLGKLDEAEQICQRLITSDKLRPLFHYLLASILYQRGQISGALLELRRTLFLDQNYILAHYMLAFLLHSEGKEKESKIHKREVLHLLSRLNDDMLVPGSEDLKVRRLREIVSHIGE